MSFRTYRSHKVVEAAPIKTFLSGGNQGPFVVLEDGEQIAVPINFAARGAPERGDYLVRYQPDGYLSWSPKAVFEAGYTEIQENAGEDDPGDCSECGGTLGDPDETGIRWCACGLGYASTSDNPVFGVAEEQVTLRAMEAQQHMATLATLNSAVAQIDQTLEVIRSAFDNFPNRAGYARPEEFADACQAWFREQTGEPG